MMDFKLEVIAFTIHSCEIAQETRAHRIELCDNPGEGGTTPSYGFIKSARSVFKRELFPIIRPRGGDFFYSDAEFRIMREDIRICKDLGCDGVVVGILNPDGTIDKKRNSKLVETAYPLGVTFHRAFDRVQNPATALQDLIEIGCERVLTSGMHLNALDGAAQIAALVQQADDRIIVMPGSGVRADNIEQIANATGAREFHTSARTLIAGGMNYKNPLMDENLQTVSLDKKEVDHIMAILNRLQ